MSKLPLAVILIGALAGCATESRDRYGEVIKIQWIAVETQGEIAEICGAGRIAMTGTGSSNPFAYMQPKSIDDLSLRGCYREVGDVCIIYTLKPVTKRGAPRSAHEDDRPVMESVGHEIEHCYRGHYHTAR